MHAFRLTTVWMLCMSLVVESRSGTCDLLQYLTVTTSNGPITGHLAPNRTCVLEYLGIPYAKPPVSDLRFAPPQKFTGNQTHEARRFGSDCPLTPSPPADYPGLTPQAPQIISYFASAAGTPQSEDCLTLNIWSKVTKRSFQSNRPVIVFFHGGRFTIGNTNTPFYNGQYFAYTEDVILITVNYRLNIFGFPGGPGKDQNLGLRDQRAAVEWIRDNIRHFGGNPSKITIAGQSSGGVAVDYWSYAYPEDPIVNGLIAASGNAFSFPLNSPEVSERNWNTVVEAVKCTDTTDVMACMRKADWRDIKDSAAEIKPSSSSSVLRSIPAFYPVVDNEIIFPEYIKLTETSGFAKLPMLLGNTHHEDGYYRIPAYSKNGVEPTPEQAELFLLESFTCPNSFQARARHENHVPVWAYRYFADWDNTRLYPTSGAYHGVDLHMIFGASGDVSGIPPSSEQEKLTALMQHAWFTFSDNAQHGLSKDLGWPEFDPGKETLILIGKDSTDAKLEMVKPELYDAPCSTVTLGALATQTQTLS